jgi:hypothetical protein
MARVVPAVGDFISFFDHDPSTNRRCIYFTLNRKSCPMLCTRADNWRVRRLRERIISDNRLDLLMDYAQYSCCSKANHQNRIENDDVLVPLGDRWMAEIESANNNPAASATEPPDDDSTQPPPGSNAASGMPVSLQTIVAPDVSSVLPWCLIQQYNDGKLTILRSTVVPSLMRPRKLQGASLSKPKTRQTPAQLKIRPRAKSPRSRNSVPTSRAATASLRR